MGTFTAVETADTTGSGSGGVASWSYAINNAAAQQLANGQAATEVHRITIDDQNGDTVTQDVAIMITGTNDEVLVSGAVATGAVVEDGTASAVGTVNFTDVDLTDHHVASRRCSRPTTRARWAPSRRWKPPTPPAAAAVAW